MLAKIAAQYALERLAAKRIDAWSKINPAEKSMPYERRKPTLNKKPSTPKKEEKDFQMHLEEAMKKIKK